MGMNDSEMSAERSSDRGFGYINSVLINVYSKDNPIKEEGEQCYFLFNSVDNYHMMIVGKGTIIRDWFTEGLHKMYCIRLDEICERNDFLEKFVWGKQYFLVNNVDSQKKLPKLGIIAARTTGAFLAMNLFKTDGFFVRDTIEQITHLREEYTRIVYQDTLDTLADMRNILTDIQ
jgi:hypothetical protein